MTARLLEEYANGESHIPNEDFIADLTGMVYIGALLLVRDIETE